MCRLTKENANVAASLGLIALLRHLCGEMNATASDARQKITDFAKKLFPQDPAKVDYPFFLAGQMAEAEKPKPVYFEDSA